MSKVSRYSRLLHVLEIVNAAGRVAPKEITSRLAARLNESADDPAFTRAVYRDLKKLADEGHLRADYFSPDGVELSPDEWESIKNVRIEYSLPARGESSVRGWKILEDAGMSLVGAISSMPWSVGLMTDVQIEGRFSLFFKAKGGAWAALQLLRGDFPAKLLIARANKSAMEDRLADEPIREAFGQRAAALLGTDPSVSRLQDSAKLGHARLDIGGDGKLSLADLESKTGTFWSPFPEAELLRTVRSLGSQYTMPLAEGPLDSAVDWKKAEGAVNLGTCALVRTGAFRMVALVRA